MDILSKMIITKVHAVSTMYTPEGTKIKRTDRPCWGLVLKYEGETVYTAGKDSYVSDPLHPILLPKGCTYDWECTRAGHFCIIEFDGTLHAPLPIRVHLKSNERILRAMKDLEHRRTLKHPYTELETLRDVYSILLMLLSQEEAQYLPSEKQQKLAPALEYISEHYNESITNDLLAAQTGLSTVYFRKLFHAVTGTSPIAYARTLRIEKAKEMLESDCGSLSDVAFSLGYPSLYDFSRDFKKHVGVPPSKYNSKD